MEGEPRSRLREQAARVLELYAATPFDGPVISFDQMGQISLKPTQGAGWAPRGRPGRLRATYNRRHGSATSSAHSMSTPTGSMPACAPSAPDSTTWGSFRRSASATQPASGFYWIQDTLSANWTADSRAYAVNNKIELVPTPTYACYLNRIESHFRPVQEFVFNNTDYPDWNTARRALADYITATAATKTAELPPSNADTGSQHDPLISGQTFGWTH